MEPRHASAARYALALKGFPDNVFQINNRLPWPKGQRLLVGGGNVRRAARSAGHEQHDEGEASRGETVCPYWSVSIRGKLMALHSISFLGREQHVTYEASGTSHITCVECTLG